MISIYCEVAAVCAIGTWIHYLKRKSQIWKYEWWELVIVYLATRLIPVLMLESYTLKLYMTMAMDMFLAAGLYGVLQKFRKPAACSNLTMLYLLNPVVILCMLSEQPLRMLFVAIGLLCIYIFKKLISRWKPQFPLIELYPQYVVGTISLFALMVAVDYQGHTLSQYMTEPGEIPLLLTLSLVGILLTEFLIYIRILKENTKKFRFSQETIAAEEKQKPEIGVVETEATEIGVEENEIAETQAAEAEVTETVEAAQAVKKERFGKKNWGILLAFTFAYAALVFFRLGSMEAPETYLHLSEAQDNRMIQLDMGEDVHISEIRVFLGYEGGRPISLASLQENGSEWEVFNVYHTIESAFWWNTVAIERELRYLAITLQEQEGYFHEMVILDSNGEQILPVNADEYEQIFDEQEVYTKYATYYHGSMFDEVYHARTAYEFIHDFPIYETTHPPLGKTLIGIGIRLFGMTPFGWRLVSALCGILMVSVVYLFAWQISRKRSVACFATGLCCTEFMHLTLSRIATLDIIVGLFILLMFYFMYGFVTERRAGASLGCQYRWLLLCGAASACAVASKWTGIYALAGLAVIFLISLLPELPKDWKALIKCDAVRQLFPVCVVSFIILPAIVYTLSYIPFTQVSGGQNIFSELWNNTKLMLSYHVNVVAEHPYASKWYDWVINRCPLVDFFAFLEGDKVSSVVTLGNSIILWTGIGSILHNVYLWRCKKEETARFLCLAFIAMLLPWLFIHRLLFVYHYFVNILIILLMFGNSMLHAGKKQQRILWLVLIASTVVFVMYLPILTGVDASRTYIKQMLEWLPNWLFA